MKNYILYPNQTRGHANHGWLNSYHSFSFSNFHDPNRMNFGALRVLNDDIVAPDMGFGTHPHQDMEIISIVLDGQLAHKDSMNNTQIIGKNDVQVMSAGTGITHSEFNPNKNNSNNFLQIWIYPDTLGVEPKYAEITLEPSQADNKWDTFIGPIGSQTKAQIQQNAYLSIVDTTPEKKIDYQVKHPDNGVYFMVLQGQVLINNIMIETKDAIGIWEMEKIEIIAKTDAKIIAIEVPMELPHYLKN